MQSPLFLSSKVPQFPGNGIWHFQQVLPCAPVVHPQLWSMMRNDKLGEYQRSALCVYTHMPYLEGAICGNRWILGHYPDECLLPSVSAEKAVPWKGSVTQRHINFLTSLQWQITRGTCLFPTCSAHARSPNPFKWTLLDDATSKHRHFILKNKPLGIVEGITDMNQFLSLPVLSFTTVHGTLKGLTMIVFLPQVSYVKMARRLSK